ncbi:peptidylprolyl isomerase [Sphingobacterium alkalisoli]|uniref:peptidylprolyl isomerase n=1 Tax=Sphingobacterium alkalisoli TaxID=1874115 RepID=A0A4U0H8S8_9SPHI|nr:peptidylprolyl isomerase [Sphingobacterium alkalisoli]TJY68277.1 peptidylprolyl isomerase [Sphingobacterium alkalisoli]
MKKLITILFLMVGSVVHAQKPTHYYVNVSTSQGNAILKLYNETPKHRDNFVKLAKEGFYDSLLFHRVIHNFMIQGGDPESRFAADRVQLGNGGLDYKIPAEIQSDLIHRKGTIGAARDNNPAKQSSASQFYFVQGRKYSQGGLDSLEQFRMKGKKLSPIQRQAYSTVGGTPHLDGNYTVFGELLTGVEIVDKIAVVETDSFDRPLKNERIAMQLLTRREAINLERKYKGLQPRNSFFTKLLDSFKSKYYTIQ